MRVGLIGSGYVGLVSGVCFAEIGHNVSLVDIDNSKIELLNEKKSPIYEYGLNDLLSRNIDLGRISFSIEYSSLRECAIIFLAVGTPSLPNGDANLKYLFSALESLLEHLEENKIVVIKSTVPVGTSEKVKSFLMERTSKKIHVVNNPEFLKEGQAVDDFLRPDRVVIGHDSEYAFSKMEELYSPLVRQGNPIYSMSNKSAELTKYASNTFLATKISFINEMAKLCDLVGADIEEVKKGMTSDRRIGKEFFYPGPGYGGSCFPKDVRALINTAENYGLDLRLANATNDVNMSQKKYMTEKISDHFKGQLDGLVFTFWGVTFKAKTDDVRESSAIEIAKFLISNGAKLNIYDPKGMQNFKKIFPSEEVIEYKDCYSALDGSDALVVLTEWNEFKTPDLNKLKSKLKNPLVFDFRNLFSLKSMKDFTYYSIGRKN